VRSSQAFEPDWDGPEAVIGPFPICNESTPGRLRQCGEDAAAGCEREGAGGVGMCWLIGEPGTVGFGITICTGGVDGNQRVASMCHHVTLVRIPEGGPVERTEAFVRGGVGCRCCGRDVTDRELISEPI